MRVLGARVEDGGTVPVHTHRWPGVQYTVSFADSVRRGGGSRERNVLAEYS